MSTASVNPVPEGYHTVTPSLIVDDAAAAIDFYQQAFDAVELMRLPMETADGRPKIGHAELKIGDSRLMLADEFPEMEAMGPKSRGGATASFMIYVPDVDAAVQQALDAGATADGQIADQFWGDRTGAVIDPFGHRWTLATHVQDVPEDEMKERMKAWSREQNS
ncbi:MAG: VOC family protein [Pseudomonadota bacterium]|nr:VOC family protein [Pseudomonadota bacterium]